MGTKYAIENFMRAYNWDYVTRAVKVSSIPGQIKVHEFDFKGINEVVYDENDVKIYAFPVIHSTKRCGSGESCTLALPPF